jgi:translation initiation factor 1A
MSRKEEEFAAQQQQQEEIRRTPIPRDRQVLGLVEQRVGGSRMKVRCMDGKMRICRIPGRLKRSLWVRDGDIILVEPWEMGGDEKGDVLFKYRPMQVEFLRRRGLLKELESVEEF